MKKILTACLMAALCQSAFADDRWKYIGRTNSEKVYIDTTRSTSNSAWIKEVKNKNSDKYKYSLIRFHIDCATKSYSILQYADYGNSNNLLNSGQRSLYNAPKEEAIPNSIGELVVNATCTQAEQRPQLSPRERAVAELNAWNVKMQRLEPAEYARLEPALLEYARTFYDLPYNQWLPAIQAEYYRLKHQSYTPQETPLSPINHR